MKTKRQRLATTFKSAIAGLSRAARRKAFRNNQPVAVTKNGKVVLIYKNNKEKKLEEVID